MSLGHFFSEHKKLMWSPSSVFDGVLPHVALCAVLVCTLTDIHLILCLEHNAHMKCIKEAVFGMLCVILLVITRISNAVLIYFCTFNWSTTQVPQKISSEWNKKIISCRDCRSTT